MRPATLDDLDIIKRMISDAKAWLKDLGTDQWSTDWPDPHGRTRSDRVRHAIENGKTWLAVHVLAHRIGSHDIPVATVTLEEAANPVVWAETEMARSRRST